MSDFLTPTVMPWQPTASAERLESLEGRLDARGRRGGERTALIKAAREFETFVLDQMLKAMDKTIDRSGLFGGGQGEEISRGMLYEEYAKSVSRAGGLGLADVILEQLDGGGDIADRRMAGLERPVEGARTSQFGARPDPITGKRDFHGGIDLAGAEGAQIRASADGTIAFSGDRGDLGKVVEIDHGGGYTTRYAHNARNLVRPGEAVHQGQLIGLVGATGRTTGPHLHFEVRRDGVAVDPEIYLGSCEKKTKVNYSGTDKK